MDHPVMNEIQALGVVPVLVVERAEDAKPLAEALLRGGMPVAEVTLRTAAGLAAISAMSAVEGLILGAGTVLSADQARAAIAAGAAFIVSPGLDDGVVAAARAAQIPVLPGIATASEAQRAWNLGLRTVKFFPAEISGGAAAVKAFSGVFRDLRFMPTGGISLSNLADYLEIPAVVACGGSWIAPENLIKAGDFDKITERAARVVAFVQEMRRAKA